MMEQNNVYKLPLLSHNVTLKPLPQQSPQATFSIAKDIPQPSQGLGYVVESVGRRKVRILAWISGEMNVFPTNEPLKHAPSGNGELHFDPWTDIPNAGAVRVHSSDGLERIITIGEYVGSGSSVKLSSCSIDLGIYAQGSHTIGTLLAACWLGACYLPKCAGQIVGAGAGRISELFKEIMSKPLPDALDEVIYRGTTNTNSVSAFERYAARQLVEAGAGQIRQIAAEHDLEMVRLETTNMFWMRFDNSEIEGLQRDIVLSVEAAFNRLSFIDLDAKTQDNDMGLVSTFNERQCSEVSNNALHMWQKHAQFVQKQNGVANPSQTVRGATAARGGIWDVMTRFTAICEQLMLPIRLEYRCDVHPRSGQMAVAFTVPTGMMMPGSELTERGFVDLRERRGAHASAYALRLAGIMAAAAFAAGMSVTSVDVTGYAGSLNSAPVLSLGFDRSAFQMGVFPAYMHGRMDDRAFDEDPAALMSILNPARYSLQFATTRALIPIEPLPIAPALRAQRVPLWKDKRELPEDLKARVRADYAYELDVMHDTGVVKGQEIWDIANTNEDSPLSAMLELESALMEIESAQGDTAGKLPLYCEHPLMRLLIIEAEGKGTDRYWKVPDALYNVHGALSRLNRETGDLEKAVLHSEEMIRIAPTTARGFVELSLDYTDVGEDYAKSADALIRGLKVAVMPIDVGFMYYRLAYALWQTKSLKEGLACYVMVLSMPQGPFHDKSRAEVGELMAEMHVEEIPDREDAMQTLKAAGIPVAPSTFSLELLAKTAIQLVDAGFPLAADEAVWLLGIMQQGDILPSLRRSLRFGVAKEEDVLAGENE